MFLLERSNLLDTRIKLIPEKTAIPSERPLTSRPRLLALLENGLAHRSATILSGRAGNGKTALAVTFALICGRPVAWYKVDASDFDLRVFLRYLGASVAQQRPGFAEETGIPAAVEVNGEAAAEWLVHELLKVDSGPLMIVLEDLHLICESEWLVPFLCRLLPLLPRNVHALITSRTMPPIPLWRMRSKQTLEVIDEATLAFTRDEAAELFEACGLTREQASTALDLSHGRAIALITSVRELGETARAQTRRRSQRTPAKDPQRGKAEVSQLSARFPEARRRTIELENAVAQLRKTEAELTRLLARERTARADAEEANRQKDQFLSTVSHDLRTPLTAILGWSRLARASDFEAKTVERAFEVIERNALSQARLIDDLMDLSRIMRGNLSIDREPVSVPKIIESALESVRSAAEGKGIELSTTLGSQPCVVYGDAVRLQQIFWNLLSNAIKFTPTGGRILVEVEKRPGQVDVSMKDTGVGIDPEFLPYVFDRFRQGNGNGAGRHGGLGLGLAIVRHLVQLHHGTIRVESKGTDQGCRFLITLSLAPVG